MHATQMTYSRSWQNTENAKNKTAGKQKLQRGGTADIFFNRHSPRSKKKERAMDHIRDTWWFWGMHQVVRLPY